MAPVPAKNLEATALHAAEHDAPVRLLPPIVARKDAVRKFMEVDALKGSPQSDSGSNFAISIVGSNLFPPIMPPPPKPNHRAPEYLNRISVEYTTQTLHGMPSPCKIKHAGPALLHANSPAAMSKNQRLAHIEMKIDGMLSSQGIHSPPHLTPHTSHLTPHTSHLTPHTSHLTPQASTLPPRSPRATAWPASNAPSTAFCSLLSAIHQAIQRLRSCNVFTEPC
jgi:hypothetical protein